MLVGCCLMVVIEPAVGQEQREVLLQVGRLFAGQTDTANVWPQFEIPSAGIICAESGLTLFVSSHGEPAISSELEGAEEVGAGQFILPQPPEGLEFVCFDLSYPMGDERLVAVPLIEKAYSITDPVLATLTLFYHESFHRFQEEQFGETSATGYSPLQEVRLPIRLINSVEFGALAEQERELLIEALQEPDLSRKQRILKHYVASRRQRMNMVPQHLREAEAHHERKEGSANLVGLELALAAAGLPESGVRGAVVDDLRNTPAFAGQDYMNNPYRHWHIYATGSAIGLLLQDFEVAWRERVQGGWTPYALLLDDVVGLEASAAHGR